MRRRWALPVGMLVVLCVALAYRLPELTVRPMHGDEAIHAEKLNRLWHTGKYVYDTHDYHGPSLYYFTLPVLWLTGCHSYSDMTEVTLRIVPALFGAGIVLLLWLISDGLGRWAAFWAGALTAISPCMSFYSRYYIQETLLVFFAFAAIVAAWRYTRSGRLIWCLLAGVCVGLMHATKETWVLSMVAMLAAAVLTFYWTHWVDGIKIKWRPHIRPKDKIRGVVLGVVVSVLLFSSFMANPRGPTDSIAAYQTYLGRGSSGTIHRHPWSYYLGMLLYTRNSNAPIFSPRLPWNYSLTPPIGWSESLIVVLAVVGLVAALWRKGIGRTHLALIRFFGFYTLLLTIIYSLVPYKTPWCMMGFLQGMIVLAGFGAVALVRSLRFVPLQTAVCLLLLAAGGQLASQAYAANFKFYADRRNPYVYAHPQIDVTHFADEMEDIARANPQGHQMTICVFMPDNDETGGPWPLPWYLRRFPPAGYWPSLDAVDPVSRKLILQQAPIIIASDQYADEFRAKLGSRYEEDMRILRPNVAFIAFIRKDIWDNFIKTRAHRTLAAAPVTQ